MTVIAWDGKTAKEAAHLACKLDVNCGMGVDALEL